MGRPGYARESVSVGNEGFHQSLADVRFVWRLLDSFTLADGVANTFGVGVCECGCRIIRRGPDRWTRRVVSLTLITTGSRIIRRGPDRWTRDRSGQQQDAADAASSDAALIDGHKRFHGCPFAGGGRRIIRPGSDR